MPNTSFLLPKQKKELLNSIIKNRPLEDFTALQESEKILQRKRNYIIKMPEKSSPVISFLSGGLDSVVVTAILMELYHLHVYPIFFNRDLSHTPYDKSSALFFQDYFLQRYPQLFHNLFEISISYPPVELSEFLLPNSGHVFLNKKLNQRRGIPSLLAIYANYALLYALYLKEQHNIEIKTIIGASLPTNIDWFAYESLSSHRLINLQLCTSMHDFSWQFLSLPVEASLGYNLKKSDLIKWGSAHTIPLEKTRTCNSQFRYHCGECDVCSVRKDAFEEACITDTTTYMPANKIFRKIIKILS